MTSEDIEKALRKAAKEYSADSGKMAAVVALKDTAIAYAMSIASEEGLSKQLRKRDKDA